MRRFVVCFPLLVLAAAGQDNRGAISGTVVDPTGKLLAGVSVQARETQGDKTYNVSSSGTGKYTITGLPAGTYDLSANLPGLRPFQKKGVMVEAAKTAALDIRLDDTTQLNTLGEDTTAIQADTAKHNPPSGPTPRTLDGKPDLTGTWWSPRTVDPGKPEFNKMAEDAARERAANNRKDSPQAHCLPSAVTRLGPVYEMVQSRQFLVIISDDDSPGFHQIYLDGRPHPKDPNPAWYGHSVGHWEGDTLVVDRVGFHPRVWLDQDAHPHTDQLHVIERYRRPDLGHLETEITVEDPGILARPWTMKRVSDLAPTEEIYEFICPENNRDLDHMIGK